MKSKCIKLCVMLLLLLVACGGGEAAPSTSVAEQPAVAEEAAIATDPPAAPTAVSEAEAATAPLTPTTASTAVPPTEAVAVEEAENPYGLLVDSFVEPSQTNGEVLILVGQVVDTSGEALPNASVEIWQTDSSGVYDHPGDPGTAGRDTTFQFFGTAVTNDEGWYAFRTILPGQYEPRPRHIHFKVKQNGETLLTSQFYFSEDVADVEQEGIFQAAGEDGDALLLQLVQDEGRLTAVGNIVIQAGSGNLTVTPAQVEGPYYPVVSLTDYDNDLTVLP